jgi:Tryptophan RNA-binding attenuator protein inhibitory protein
MQAVTADQAVPDVPTQVQHIVARVLAELEQTCASCDGRGRRAPHAASAPCADCGGTGRVLTSVGTQLVAAFAPYAPKRGGMGRYSAIRSSRQVISLLAPARAELAQFLARHDR